MDYQTIDFRRDGDRAVIMLNRPAFANAVDRRMAAELAHAAHRCAGDGAVRAVLLGAHGKFFCAGGDLKLMASLGEDAGPGIKLLAEDFHQAISSFARMRAPLVVAVNGPAAGAGFSLAIAGDLVVAADGASFTMAYTAAGLSPDGSSSFYLPRLVGLRRAQELMLTNRRLDARQALEWGLVSRVVPGDALMDDAMGLAAKLADGSLEANGCVKKLLLSTFGESLETQMALEARAIASCVAGPDGREGIGAFLGKRAPRFPR